MCSSLSVRLLYEYSYGYISTNFFVFYWLLCVAYFFFSYRFNSTRFVSFEILLNFHCLCQKENKKTQRIKMPNAFAFAWILSFCWIADIWYWCVNWNRLQLMISNLFNLSIMFRVEVDKNKNNNNNSSSDNFCFSSFSFENYQCTTSVCGGIGTNRHKKQLGN